MLTVEMAKEKLDIAQSRYDRDCHGRDAFLGSSAYSDYSFAKKQLDMARQDFEEAVEANRKEAAA